MESQPQNPEFRINPENSPMCSFIENSIELKKKFFFFIRFTRGRWFREKEEEKEESQTGARI